MKAVICTAYGAPEVLKIADVNKPVAKDNEVLIAIKAASASSGDSRMRSFDVPSLMKLPFKLIVGIRKPRNPILGSQYSGVVESVGSIVTKFKPGDKVYGITGMKMSCYASYVTVKESSVIDFIPDTLSYEEAVPIPFGGMTALHLLNKAKIDPGDRILVYGASGSVGTYAIQLANYFGCVVTAVCSKKNFDLVRNLGATDVIDYQTQNLTSIPSTYDIVFDAVGKISKKSVMHLLTDKGRFISVKMMTNESLDKLTFLSKLAKEGKLTTVIDKIYPMEAIVDAHRHVDTGHKVGNIVIHVE